MMKSLYSLGIIAVLLAVGSVAMAYPTLDGETGIVALPNALTAGSGSVVGAADLLFDDQNTLKGRVLYGINDRAEVGASFSSGIVSGVSISGKYRLTDARVRFNLAAGGSLILADQHSTALDLYLVGTQAFHLSAESGKVILGTFGVHFLNFQDDQTFRPFVGAQYLMGKHTQLAAEYQLKDGNFFKSPLTSVVLRHQITADWSGQVGLTNANGYGATGDYRPFIGAQYTFTQGR